MPHKHKRNKSPLPVPPEKIAYKPINFVRDANTNVNPTNAQPSEIEAKTKIWRDTHDTHTPIEIDTQKLGTFESHGKLSHARADSRPTMPETSAKFPNLEKSDSEKFIFRFHGSAYVVYQDAGLWTFTRNNVRSPNDFDSRKDCTDFIRTIALSDWSALKA